MALAALALVVFGAIECPPILQQDAIGESRLLKSPLAARKVCSRFTTPPAMPFGKSEILPKKRTMIMKTK